MSNKLIKVKLGQRNTHYIISRYTVLIWEIYLCDSSVGSGMFEMRRVKR